MEVERNTLLKSHKYANWCANKKKKKTETKKKGPISQIRKYACLDQPR